MYDLALATILHIIGVVLSIGGVAFVTTVLLPTVRQFKSKEERIVFFEKAEHRFARQARLTTLSVGLTGFYMVERYNMWERFIILVDAHGGFNLVNFYSAPICSRAFISS